ncbi:MAG: phosphatase PAP2 family protein, partial [Candidatus Acidulodesulfobacterium sp.]
MSNRARVRFNLSILFFIPLILILLITCIFPVNADARNNSSGNIGIGEHTGAHSNNYTSNRNRNTIDNLYYVAAGDIKSYPSFLLKNKDYVLGFAAILGSSFLLDRGMHAYMVHHQNNAASFASNTVYPFGKPYYTFPAAGLFSLYGYYTKNIKLMNASFTSMESGLAAGVIAEAIKVTAGRERPYGTNNPFEFKPFNIKNKYNSFPSGDATIAWSMVTPYAVYYKQPLLYLIPAAVDAERVYKNKHWLSDTVMGSAIGFSIGYLFSNNHISKDITFNSSGNNILINVKF